MIDEQQGSVLAVPPAPGEEGEEGHDSEHQNHHEEHGDVEEDGVLVEARFIDYVLAAKVGAQLVIFGGEATSKQLRKIIWGTC